MNAIKTGEEIEYMAQGGKKLGVILQELLEYSEPGVTLRQIDARADELILKAGGTASFKTVKGYQWATCLCVNEVVVHGIPTAYVLKEGDVLTIDIGLLYKGFHTDTAWTKIIENRESRIENREDNEKRRFLKIGEEALWKAIGEAKVGNRIGHITKTIQETVEGAGYGVVRTLVGHGVGHELHEAPQVPGLLKGTIEETPLLMAGMTLAIEVIYAMGNGAVVYDNDDGWTIATRDRSLTAVFEHTIVITAAGPRILTKPEN